MWRIALGLYDFLYQYIVEYNATSEIFDTLLKYNNLAIPYQKKGGGEQCLDPIYWHPEVMLFLKKKCNEELWSDAGMGNFVVATGCVALIIAGMRQDFFGLFLFLKGKIYMTMTGKEVCTNFSPYLL